MNARAKVLLVGHDPLLLETRRELLRTLVEAESTDNSAEAAAAIEACSLALVIFCHTLTSDECRELSDLARSKASPPKILGLCSPKSPERVGFVDCSLSLGYGPAKLIDTAAAMLEVPCPRLIPNCPPAKMGVVGEHWRLRPSEIEAWLNTRTEKRRI